MTLSLVRVHESPAHSLTPILRESHAEGVHFLSRLVHEWESGANRFAKPGELLLALRLGPSSLAVCGLNRDPFARSESIGRLRHLYVAKAWRRQGWGRRMVRVIVSQASARFRLLRLRTDSRAAEAFYFRLGFCEVVEPDATHVLWLAPSDPARGRAAVREA
jgi:GNAT superfamily N-acetyltransferase